jgi:predicted nuclease of restriction endonuclease-like (RecB) superfamily
VETLARDLQAEFPGRNGFSARSLWNMREFYREYVDKPNLLPAVAEISWTKNLTIFSRCKDDLEREFYLRATAQFGWTKAVLQHQVDSKSYERYLLNQTNFDAMVPEEIKNQALLAVKDHYTFDFLGLADEHSEHDLEQALVKNVRSFLTEMGGAYAFIGNQYRLEVGGQEYFIDLLLFHRRLRCLVAIELKIGDFKPEHKSFIWKPWTVKKRWRARIPRSALSSVDQRIRRWWNMLCGRPADRSGWRPMRLWLRYRRLIDRNCRVRRRLPIGCGCGMEGVDTKLGKIVLVLNFFCA